MSSLRRLLVPLLLCVLTCVAGGSEPRVGSVISLGDLTRQSGYIFAGTVIAIDRQIQENSSQPPVMRLTFRVDQAIRGVRAGQLLVIREWAGLWDSGDRYRVGEHLVLFLYPPSKMGLTSPAGGSLGRFAMNANGEVILQQARQAALFSEAASSGITQSQLLHKTPAAAPRMSSTDLVRAVRRVEE